MNIIERLGIQFGYCLRIEGVMKDFIILKKNPSLVTEINEGDNRNFNQERTNILKDSFSEPILDDFLELYDSEFLNMGLTRADVEKNFSKIMAYRDTYGHSRPLLSNDIIFHMPKDYLREKRLNNLDVQSNDPDKPISARLTDKDTENIRNIFQKIDSEFFRELAKQIGVKYDNLR